MGFLSFHYENRKKVYMQKLRSKVRFKSEDSLRSPFRSLYPSFYRLAELVILSGGIADCGGGSNSTATQAPAAPSGQGNCPSVGNLTPTPLGTNECQFGGVLTTSTTLSANITWFLEGALQVGTATDTVVLSMDPGTEVRGSGTDHVLVFPGSAIQANGTSASPVRFSSDDSDVTGTGEWGGLFIRGFNGLPTLTGTQGEKRLDYVVVAEAAAAVAISVDGQNGTYEDNIVLNGLDSNTTLTFVQSHNSARDGIRLANGDPRLSWILVTGATRDGIWYRDFNGLIKDLMVIHNPDTDGSTGRAGIYASETATGNSNPRIVNATLVGRDSTSTAAAATDNEFGILFADNTDQIRLANVVIANFRNGCFEADSAADLSMIDSNVPGPNYLDGVHCANEAGPNGMFGVVRTGAVGFPAGVVAASNSTNANGLVYYNGAVNAVTFTGEVADRSSNFTAGWYLNNIGGIGNGLVTDGTALNAFLDGDTNNDGLVNAADTNSTFVVSDDGAGGFNQDVASDTGGYDLTHIGAVRGGAITNTQFDGWTLATGNNDGFAVQQNDALSGTSTCPTALGGATITPMDRSGGRNVCQIAGVMISNATLTSNTEWALEGALQVGNNVSIATLTIEAGTRIRGDNVDATDHLLIWPGSNIDAQGTGSRPVRFSSDDLGVGGSGEWGGLFLRGFNGLPTLTGTQGANRLDYVVVAEAGASVTVTIDGQAATYSDNIVLNGVSSATTLTFVQSHNSARDGLRLMNGDPRLSWVLATGAVRDGIWYRDFNGLIKDLMVIHNRDTDGSTGRAGIYASETTAGDSNPRIVNATLVGRDNASTAAAATDNEFGILFADNTDQIRMVNVLIANFRNGCFEADSAANLSLIDTTGPGPNYLDGIHCANEAGANGSFGVVRAGAVGFPAGTVAANNSNGNGLVYYNGAVNAVNFTGEASERGNNFTAGWYLSTIGTIGNGLVGNVNFLNGFLDGDTNQDGVVDAVDTMSSFFIADDGVGGFNQDVASDTGGYDLTHVGAVRGGAVTNVQFDNWTVGTLRSDSFTVR